MKLINIILWCLTIILAVAYVVNPEGFAYSTEYTIATISITTTFVNTPVEKLFQDLVIGCDLIDKGASEVLQGFRKEIALNRFFTTGDNITVPPADGKWDTVTKNNSSTKDEKAMVLTEIYWANEFNTRDFNVDHKFLWSQGPDGMMVPSNTLMAAITPSVIENFNNELDRLFWSNAGAKLDTGLIALLDADATVIDTALPAVPIDAADVIERFEEMLTLAATTNPAITVLGSPAFLVPYDVAAFYQEASRALPNKGMEITAGELPPFGGYTVIAQGGMTDGSAIFIQAGGGEGSNIKTGFWQENNRNTLEVARTGPLDDTFGLKIALSVGIEYIYGKEIVWHKGSA